MAEHPEEASRRHADRTDLTSLATPALLLERRVLERNAARMRARMAAAGVRLRPHLKTAKSVEAATLAAGAGGPVTVSTLREAEFFHAAGFHDLLYGVGLIPARFDRVDALSADGARLTVALDSLEVADALAAHRRALGGAPLRVLIEIDSGGARGGLLPDDPLVCAIGRRVHGAPGLTLAGVMTHAGHAYACETSDAVVAVAQAERAALVAARDAMTAAGLPCAELSAGSSPTAVHVVGGSGITEMRPGVYLFNDLSQFALGACAREDLALSVLASVIGHNRHAGLLLLDSGALALSMDTGVAAAAVDGLGYHGELCDPSTLAPLGLHIESLHQEHALVPVNDPRAYEALPIGSHVRVLPMHACMTAAAYDGYAVVDEGQVTERWGRLNGW